MIGDLDLRELCERKGHCPYLSRDFHMSLVGCLACSSSLTAKTMEYKKDKLVPTDNGNLVQDRSVEKSRTDNRDI
jgi:hypothetical protein